MINTNKKPDYSLDNGNKLIWLCGKYAVEVVKTEMTGKKVIIMPCFYSRRGIKPMDYIQSQCLGLGTPEILVNEESIDYHIDRLITNMSKTFIKPGSCKFSGLK